MELESSAKATPKWWFNCHCQGEHFYLKKGGVLGRLVAKEGKSIYFFISGKSEGWWNIIPFGQIHLYLGCGNGPSGRSFSDGWFNHHRSIPKSTHGVLGVIREISVYHYAQCIQQYIYTVYIYMSSQKQTWHLRKGWFWQMYMANVISTVTRVWYGCH